MSIEAHPQTPPRQLPDWAWHLGVITGAAVWFGLYKQLPAFSEWLTALLPVDRHSHAGEAIAFFLYDVPKVKMLLALIVFAMGVVRSYFSPEKTRALLSGKREGVGNVMAATRGIFTPFCSCSAVPLFIGFVSAGVPLGVTFSFLIAAPMVNEVAVFLLWGLVGWKVAVTYLAFGLGIAIVAGWVIGKLHLEGWLQDWVRDIHSGANAPVQVEDERLTMVDRYRLGIEAVREIFGKVWVWIILGIGMGALIHGYVPEDLMVRIMGADAWWSVPAAVVIGIPMYTNAAGVIPIVEALLGKGAALGTVLAFMMSVIALSPPEMIILRQVLTLRLIAVFVGVVGSGILAVGFLFNRSSDGALAMNPQMKFHLVFSFVMGALMISVMAGFITAINLGVGPGFLVAWAGAFALACLVGVPTIFLLAPVARRIIGRILGVSPATPLPTTQEQQSA